MEKKRRAKTPKEQLFVAEYLRNGGNQTKAALKAYNHKGKNPEKVASSHAVKLMKKLDMIDYLERNGFTPDHAAKTIYAATEANKIHGTDSDFIEIPDHPTRIKAVELGLKAAGLLKEQNNTQINVFGQLDSDMDKYMVIKEDSTG